MVKKKAPSKSKASEDGWGALRPDNPTSRPLHRTPKPVRLADDPVENQKKA